MAAAAPAEDGIVIADSVTKLGPDDAGKVAMTASHGGIYAGYVAAKAGARGVILHDAGVGKDRAGIASLDWLQELGIAAAMVDHRSCRIGSGRSMAEDGIVSFVNEAAEALGCRPGQKALACARAMLAAEPSQQPVPAIAEARFVLRERDGEPLVMGCDSTSLVRAEDLGQIVVTGSHGEVLEDAPTWGSRPDVAAAIFHDAGIAVATHTASRLPDLDTRAIPAAVVAADSARIGDARSIWETGIVSQVNATARARNGQAGMTVPEFVDRMIATR
jgi:hypothetical protein